MYDHLNETQTANLTAAQLTDWIRDCFYDLEQRIEPFLVYETPFSQHCLAFDWRPRHASFLISSSHLDVHELMMIATRLIDSQGYWYDDCDENRYTVTVGTSFDVDESLPIFELNEKFADTMRLTPDFNDNPHRYLSIQIEPEDYTC